MQLQQKLKLESQMDNRVHIRVSRRFLVVAIAFPSSLRAPCPHSKNLNKLKRARIKFGLFCERDIAMQRRGGGGGSMPNCLGEDVINDIIKRLPAKSVASAACVCRSWRNQAAKILCTPKLMSALSQNQRLEVISNSLSG